MQVYIVTWYEYDAEEGEWSQECAVYEFEHDAFEFCRDLANEMRVSPNQVRDIRLHSKKYVQGS